MFCSRFVPLSGQYKTSLKIHRFIFPRRKYFLSPFSCEYISFLSKTPRRPTCPVGDRHTCGAYRNFNTFKYSYFYIIFAFYIYWNNILGHVGFRWVSYAACRGLRWIFDRSPMSLWSGVSVSDGFPIITIYSCILQLFWCFVASERDRWVKSWTPRMEYLRLEVLGQENLYLSICVFRNPLDTILIQFDLINMRLNWRRLKFVILVY